MRRVMKWILLTAVCMLLTTSAGCGCGGGDVTGIALRGGGQVAVGSPLQLSVVKFVRYPDDRERDWQVLEAGLAWSVQPSDGAAVSSAGVFKATKPGTYTVTVRALGFSDSNGVRAIEAESTTTTEQGDEEETTSSQNESTATTETAVKSAYFGTYKGEWTTRAGDLPCEFAIDADGLVTGKFDYHDPKGATYTFEFEGDVSLSGKLLAIGVVTLNGMAGDEPFIQHTSISLEGQISEAGFIGAWTAKTGVSGQVKATLQ